MHVSMHLSNIWDGFRLRSFKKFLKSTGYRYRTRNFHAANFYNNWGNGRGMREISQSISRTDSHQEGRTILEDNFMDKNENIIFYN